MSNNNLIPVQDIERMAIAVVASGLFGMRTKEQAVALMLVAQSEGLHPARAAMEYHIIQGKPALKADAMLSRFQSAGGKVEWHEYSPEKVSATFSHPQGGSVRIEWTMKMAEDAKLTGKDTWKQYPRQMLRARVISEGIRTVFPGVSVGIYTPEEVQDFVPQEKDITPAPVTPPPEHIKQKAKEMKAWKPSPDHKVIEGSAETITGDEKESDLSGIGNNKPDLETIRKVVDAFAKIGFTIEELEYEYGKGLDDWTMEDVAEAREIFKIKNAEREKIIQEISANKAAKNNTNNSANQEEAI